MLNIRIETAEEKQKRIFNCYKNRLINEDLHPSLRNYRYLPILIYILDRNYNAVFASKVTI